MKKFVSFFVVACLLAMPCAPVQAKILKKVGTGIVGALSAKATRAQGGSKAAAVDSFLGSVSPRYSVLSSGVKIATSKNKASTPKSDKIKH